MTFEKISDNIIRIILSEKDMLNFNLTYQQMDYGDKSTKKVILRLVEIAKIKQDFPLDSQKVYIEAFPYENNGCVLYINSNPNYEQNKTKSKAKSFDTPLIFEFDDIDNVTKASIFLLENLNHVIVKSSLYLYEGKYRMLIYTYCKMETKITTLLSEYSYYIGKGSVLSSFVKEHGTFIILDNCIETINKHLA